jgi:hypothetical protein
MKAGSAIASDGKEGPGLEHDHAVRGRGEDHPQQGEAATSVDTCAVTAISSPDGTAASATRSRHGANRQRLGVGLVRAACTLRSAHRHGPAASARSPGSALRSAQQHATSAVQRDPDEESDRPHFASDRPGR